jgi:hypothetical protein
VCPSLARAGGKASRRQDEPNGYGDRAPRLATDYADLDLAVVGEAFFEVTYDKPRTALEDCQKLCRCCVRLPALYLVLGLKPIVQVVTLCPSAPLVKFVGTLLNLLLNGDQDGRLI